VFTGSCRHAKAFIAALAGLAMLRVLQTAFTVSFRDRSRWARSSPSSSR